MRKIRMELGTGFLGCDYEDEIEVSDDMTEEQIDKMVKRWMWNHISLDWEEIDEDEGLD